MKSKKALITGASGFIGSNLVGKLISEQWQVSVILRIDSSLDQLHEYNDRISIYRYDGTINSMIEIVSLAKPDIVFHLASLFLANHNPNDIDNLVQSNILFGTHLLEAMYRNGISFFINTGTSWQHYQNQDYNPVCLYAATKQAYEAIITYYVEAMNFKVITLKLFDTYGTGDPRAKLLALLKDLLNKNETLGMSGGEQIINLVHIDDVVEAFFIAANRLLESNNNIHETYAVTANEQFTLKQLVEIIETIMNTKLSIQWGSRAYRVREVMTPWNKGEKLPDWEPKVDVRNGLKDYFSN